MAEKQPEKKASFLARTKRSSRASMNELKKVRWPSKKELVKYTEVVIAAVAAVGVMIWIVDSAISALFGLIL